MVASDVSFLARHMVTPDASAEFYIHCLYVKKNDFMNNLSMLTNKSSDELFALSCPILMKGTAKTWKGCLGCFSYKAVTTTLRRL